MEDFIAGSKEMFIFVSDFTDGSFEISDSPLANILIDKGSEPLKQLCGNKNIHPADNTIITEFCSELLGNSDASSLDSRYTVNFRVNVSQTGEPDYHWAVLTAILQKDELNKIQYAVGHIRLMNASDLFTKSMIDSFTNDKHPAVFAGGAKRLLECNDGRQFAIVQFDIEKFKAINVRYGEDKGTEILNYITHGLDSVCTSEQVHLRLSADVFMIAMLFNKTEEIERLICNIEERLGHYGNISYKLVFGVHIVSDRTLPLRKMGDRAAMARQGIKGNALQNVGYYSDNQEDSLISKKFIEDRMYYALEHGEFVMFLQPKFSISNSSIVGAEALVRWIHPDKGMISPAEFIPIFEKNGFIIKLDEYMWEQACKTIRKWLDNGIQPVPISVNISRIHLENDNFIKVLDSLVEKYNISKSYIETEITESVENTGTEEMIKKLKESGYMLLMDDFGSGYSSLNMLKSTPFDIIKIDRDFFSEFMLSDRGKKIILHTISMSKDIGLDLVAEGVETKEQAEFLSDCGCDVAQGFYYSRPVCLNDFENIAFDKKVQK